MADIVVKFWSPTAKSDKYYGPFYSEESAEAFVGVLKSLDVDGVEIVEIEPIPDWYKHES